MIFRSLTPRQYNGAPRPAAQVFLSSQQSVPTPYVIVPQAVHSLLAGDLTRALLDEPFGPIHPEVIEAARVHDFGWDASDQQQLSALSERGPKPFAEVPEIVEINSWRKSIQMTAGAAPLVQVMVSRHFCCLAGTDRLHQEFLAEEIPRRQTIEQTLPYSPADLDRWTAALGFCDLLCLYLCCGATAPVDFPLAHPAAKDASAAPQVTLTWQTGSLQFSQPILKPNAAFHITALEYSGQNAQLTDHLLEWTFSSTPALSLGSNGSRAPEEADDRSVPTS